MPKTAAAVKEHQARGHPWDEGGVDERHVDVGTRAIVQDYTTARALDEHVRYAQLATIRLGLDARRGDGGGRGEGGGWRGGHDARPAPVRAHELEALGCRRRPRLLRDELR